MRKLVLLSLLTLNGVCQALPDEIEGPKARNLYLSLTQLGFQAVPQAGVSTLRVRNLSCLRPTLSVPDYSCQGYDMEAKVNIRKNLRTGGNPRVDLYGTMMGAGFKYKRPSWDAIWVGTVEVRCYFKVRNAKPLYQCSFL